MMLRRWMRAYAAWDERTYERIARVRTRPLFRVLMVGLLWVNVMALPVFVWRIRPDVNLPLGFAAAAAVCAAFTVMMNRQLRKELREDRQRSGCCLTCGYDLRAHEEGECCPECGTAVGRVHE